ncbi:MAG: hypothetical protein WC624_07140 [Candidatus Margulisiibacteriota bacterium]
MKMLNKVLVALFVLALFSVNAYAAAVNYTVRVYLMPGKDTAYKYWEVHPKDAVMYINKMVGAEPANSVSGAKLEVLAKVLNTQMVVKTVYTNGLGIARFSANPGSTLRVTKQIKLGSLKLIPFISPYSVVLPDIMNKTPSVLGVNQIIMEIGVAKFLQK